MNDVNNIFIVLIWQPNCVFADEDASGGAKAMGLGRFCLLLLVQLPRSVRMQLLRTWTAVSKLER